MIITGKIYILLVFVFLEKYKFSVFLFLYR